MIRSQETSLAAWLITGVASAALASVAVPASAAPNAAVSALIRQAAFWRARGRGELAVQSLEKALAADPNNADALAALAAYAAEDGDASAARKWIARLRTAAPTDPRLSKLARAAEAPSAASIVTRARQAVAARDAVRAVALYRQAFAGGPPPPAYELEYYQTLAGTAAGWDEARQGLKRLVAARPADQALQLAYAQALTYRPATRREGIAALQRLASGLGPQASQARQAWRQALVWLGGSAKDAPLYQAYLSLSPQDAAIQAELGKATAGRAQPAQPEQPSGPVRTARVDRGAEARADGFQALNHGDEALAESRFTQALKIDPGDMAALGGLGLVRLRQEKFAEAKALLARASNGGRDERWTEALESARFFADLRKAQALADRQPAAAEALLRPLAAQPGKNRALAQQLLGDVLTKEGKYAEAEGVYRAAASANPAAAGPALAAARARAAHAEGNRLWQAGDLANADNAFETALAADPTDPWIRYDFARLLLAQGAPDAARGLMSVPAASNSAEGVFAAALFANNQGDPAEAMALMGRIPAQARTPQMRTLIDDLQVSSALASAREARQAGRTFEAAAAVEAVAARPNLSVANQSEVAGALYELGDPGRAIAMAEQALITPSDAGPSAYEGFVSVLAKSGRDAEAGALVRQLAARSPPTADNRRALASLTASLAAERSDRLRLAGDYAGAFDTLSAAFAVAPRDTRLLSALARLYQSGNMPAQAGQAFEALLQVQPGDPDALAGVAEAALARGDVVRARAAVGQALARRGSDPQLYLLSARVSQAAGDRSGALRALSMAKSLRQQQIARPVWAAGAGGIPAAAGGGVLGPNPFARSAAPEDYGPTPLPMAAPGAWPAVPAAATATPAAYAPPAPAAYARAIPAAYAPAVPAAYPQAAPATYAPIPAAYAPAAAPAPAPFAVAQGPPVVQDQVLAAIDQQVAQLAPVEQPQMGATAGFRGRSGEQGLSRLNELSGEASVSIPVFGSGRLTAEVTPVELNAGTAAETSWRRFGTNAIPDALGVVDPKSGLAALDPGPQSASGVAVSLALQVAGFKGDAGTTPIGMGPTRFAGGASYEQKFGSDFVAKAYVERRPMTDSLASYAGAKDPVTGAIWGEVMRDSAGGNLSYDTTAYGVYAQGQANHYDGRNVQDNSGYEVNVGAYVRPYRTDTSRLQIGANLNHQHYDNNQNFFTVGHGGYFSPQEFTSMSLPVSYTVKQGRWRLEFEAAPGYQTYTERAEPYFPLNPALQGQLAALAAQKDTIEAVYPALTKDGFAANGRVLAAYQLSKRAEVGGEAKLNTFGDYNETRFDLFLRIPFGLGGGQ